MKPKTQKSKNAVGDKTANVATFIQGVDTDEILLCTHTQLPPTNPSYRPLVFVHSTLPLWPFTLASRDGRKSVLPASAYMDLSGASDFQGQRCDTR